MILEHAVINVTPGSSEQFEEALGRARSIVAGSPGFRSLSVHRGIEEPDRYVLLIGWDTLDDHVNGFRGSPAFAQWRALIGSYFASPPDVEHLAEVDLPPAGD